MATDATIPRVSRPRGVLTKEQLRRIESARRSAEAEQARYRRVVVYTLAEGASFAEVSKATGLSTNTLQRWKREAT